MADTGRPAKRARLLSDESESESSDFSDASQPNLKINQEYAKRFEHNKKREELHRLQDKYGDKHSSRQKDDSASSDSQDDTDSESDESEDEGDLATVAVDNEIRDVLQALRNKDERIYDKKHQFYTGDVQPQAAKAKAKPAEKAVHLRDYHRDNLLSGANLEDPEDSEPPITSYNQEQSDLKRQLLAQASATDDNDDDFLVAKPGQEPKSRREILEAELDVAEADRDPEKFLLDFVTSDRWKKSEASQLQPFESDDDSDDARADAYEDAYNMRFEDPAKSNEKLISHSREAAAKYSVRREELTGRQKAREREKAQRDAEKRERDEEKARFRNLKLEEAQEKLKRFKQAAGIRNQEIGDKEWAKFLEAGFDSDKWEAEMAKRFDNHYYDDRDDADSTAAHDSEAETESKRRKRLIKPKWDDDIDIGDLVPDFEEDEEDDPRFQLTDDESGGVAVNGEDADDEDGKEAQKLSTNKKDLAKARAEAKRAHRKDRRRLEDIIDQQILESSTLPSNGSSSSAPLFRYRETSPQSFGLSSRDILMAEDSQLNEFVGLKKLAAFRADDKKKKDKKNFSKKARLRKWRMEAFGDQEGPTVSFEEFMNRRRRGQEVSAETNGIVVDGKRRSHGDEGSGPSKKRRRANKNKIKGQA